MSAKERPEVAAFRELETLVKHLADELATARQRALKVEKSTEAAAAKTRAAEKASALDAANSTLKTKLDRAEERVKQMIERVRFLRQQLQSEVTGSRS